MTPAAAVLDDALDGIRHVERVLRERAQALAAPPDAGEGAATAAHLVALVGPATVAVPALAARHVVPAGPLTRLPGSGSAIIGFVAALGTLVPVADAAVLLGLELAPTGAGSRRLLLLDDGDGLLGLLVDAVPGMVLLDLGCVRPEVEHASGLVAGTTTDGCLVLDVDAVLADPRLRPPGRADDRNPIADGDP